MATFGNHPSPPLSSPDVDAAIFRLEELQRCMAKAESENTARQRSYTNLSRSSNASEIPLGKFAASTATFSWPGLRPLSQLEQPRMFRNPANVSFTSYRQVSDPGAWSSSSSCTSPALSFCTASESASLKRSLSQSEEDDGSSSDTSYDSEKQLGGIRIIRTRKELFHDDSPKSPSGIVVAADVTPPSPPPRRRSTPRKTPPPIMTDLRSTPDDDQPDTSGQEVLPKTDWERFAQHIQQNDFKCKWTECKYLGKKQLVKRHIETTHLKLKPFACTFCSRRFPQKTSLNVHIASKHTRNNPYKCPFEGCQKAYNDPARLHRHKTDIHSYIPKATTRCNKKRSRISPSTSDYEMVSFTMPSSSRS